MIRMMFGRVRSGDALPVREQTGLPFASTAKGEYRGKEVDVMVFRQGRIFRLQVTVDDRSKYESDG